MRFQWKYFLKAPWTRPPSILNIGCSSDPLAFEEDAHHFDMDDWSKRFKYFTQGDAHHLPFEDQSFHTVVMGDIIEHLVEPRRAVLEACRVAQQWVVMTIFEEWRLPGHGQFIKEGQALAAKTSQEQGFEDPSAFNDHIYPDRVGYDDYSRPHLSHINQFSHEDIASLVAVEGFKSLEFLHAYEAELDGHPFYNWLVCLERLK